VIPAESGDYRLDRKIKEDARRSRKLEFVVWIIKKVSERLQTDE
jgi:hypothetical protein